MALQYLSNGKQQENPYEVSPLSSDAGSISRHESWLSGRFDLMLPPIRQNHNEQDHHQRFVPNWPPPPGTPPGHSTQHIPVPMPPNNTPVVTPEESLEDVSLDGQSSPNNIHQELEERLQDVQFANLAPAVHLRPSSFEIMGCVPPSEFKQLARTRIGRAGQPGASQYHHGRQYGLNRTLTPYPSGTAPAGILSVGTRCIRFINNSEDPAPGREVTASQNGTLRAPRQSHQTSSYEHFGIKRLIILIVSCGLALASFLLLTQSVAVMTVFRAADEPLNPGYIVECVLSIIILLPSIACLVLVFIGKDIVFPYTLRSPFARRQPPQPKEFELASTSRPVTTNIQDIERGEVQHQVILQPTTPVQGPAESRELLLQAAASNPTVAPSTTQTSIVTELCDAVCAPDTRP
ncbi:hypothetical protein VM1G_05613 [Cytospora mali]|uniref:Uncharacterized protein n=1 Tax=Cytospora mali TaxID=578113 RepID=A0A194VZ97_CYTMA|nr:hypothetical protein VM1G_05613 [Valsa mali]